MTMKNTNFNKFVYLVIFLLSAPFTYAQASCIDTLMYPEAKATSFSLITMNVPSEFAGYSQYYAAPQEVIVKGFKVYAGVNSANPLDTAIVKGFLREADTDSAVGTILREKEFTVSNTYTPDDIEMMAYYVIFDTPDTVSSGFHIGVETETTQPLAIVTNDFTAGDGLNEKLGYWFWTGDEVWYRSSEFFEWDLDFLILPIVEYLPVNSINIHSVGCVDDPSCISYNASEIVKHPMYNEYVFNEGIITDTVSFDWGDDSITDYPDTCHTYSSNGSYDVVANYITGWNTTCLISDSIELSPHPAFEIIDLINECDSYTWPINGMNYLSDIIDTASYSTINGCDSIHILNLVLNHSSTGTDVLIACDSLSWIDGIMYTESSTASFNIVGGAINGCDSLVTLDLTINTLDNSVTQDNNTLSANLLGASYQWIDCENEYAPIPEATEQTYVATENGTYAVIITFDDCTDTSDCIMVSNIGLYENNIGESIKIYPSPTTGNLTIELESSTSTSIKSIAVYTMFGTLVQHKEISSKADVIELNIEGATGVYIIEVQTESQKAIRRRIIKK